jgi:hypothetical protein
MTVFVPPSPTGGALAAIDGTGNTFNSSPDTNNQNTDPFTQASPDNSNNPNQDNSDPTTPDNNNNPTTDGTNPPQNKSIQPTDTMPLPTKIGIGIGVGAGSLLLVAAAVWLLWKKRMARRRARDDDDMLRGDVERGASPTPQEKAKLDFESEHDVAFDFGGFFRERGGRRGAAAAAGGGAGGDGGVSRSNSASSNGSGRTVVAGAGERLPAFEMPLGQKGQGQGQPPRQQVVAELDGGAVPEYRGVVGYAR